MSLTHNVALWSTSLICKLNFLLLFRGFEWFDDSLRGCIIAFGQYKYVFLVVSIREQYPYLVLKYVVPIVWILYLCQSYLQGSIQI